MILEQIQVCCTFSNFQYGIFDVLCSRIHKLKECACYGVLFILLWIILRTYTVT